MKKLALKIKAMALRVYYYIKGIPGRMRTWYLRTRSKWAGEDQDFKDGSDDGKEVKFGMDPWRDSLQRQSDELLEVRRPKTPWWVWLICVLGVLAFVFVLLNPAIKLAFTPAWMIAVFSKNILSQLSVFMLYFSILFMYGWVQSNG